MSTVSFPRFIAQVGCAAIAFTTIFAGSAKAQTFMVYAQTHDRVAGASLFDHYDFGIDSFGDPTLVPVYRAVRAFQGSFGAPSINDKGNVAYSCILAGGGLGAFTSNSVVVRPKHASGRVAVQAGHFVDDGFGWGGVPQNSSIETGSSEFYRMCENVAINNGNAVAYGGQVLFTYKTVTKDKTTFTDSQTQAFGIARPNDPRMNSFSRKSLVSFTSYTPEFLTHSMSVDAQNAVAYNASFFITSTIAVEGFAYSAGTDTADNVVATVDSNVIGLPFLSTYSHFSDAVISNRNVAFVTAQIQGSPQFVGIWAGNNPNLKPIAVITNKAPGGGTFSSFTDTSGPSHSGKYCAFIATTSTGTTGVFRATVNNKGGSGYIQVAAVGGNAPGTSSTFASFTLAGSNDAGQVVLLGTAGTQNGIWVSNASGTGLRLVALVGQNMTIKSATKTITDINFNPLAGMNRSGQVAFTASFTDRTSAVIVASF
jgi:hypothetical protein